MSRQYGPYALLICCLLVLMGCGGISKEARSQITYSGPFDVVQQQPEKYRGETIMWGGKVIGTRTKDDATEMVLLQLGLGSQQRPQDNDQSQGRFIIRSRQFLDPAIYPQGTLITVVGPLTGAELRKIGEMEYRYPVIDIAEIKKWEPKDNSSPRIHFGFGISTHF